MQNFLALTRSKSLTALLFAVASLLVALALPAFASADIPTHVRIETPTETLFNGDVTTGDRPLISEDLPGTANFCDSNEPAGPPTYETPTHASGGPTANSAVHDATELLGLTYGTSGSRYGFGIAMCRIGSYGTVDNVQSWSVKINNEGHPNGGFVSGSTALKAGDDVLWYLGGPNVTRTLALNLPATTPAGSSTSGKVTVYKNSDDSKAATVIGAKIEGGGATANVRTDGAFNITFPEEGTYLVGASAPNAARTSEMITVTPPLTPAQVASLVKKRVSACRKRYATGKKKSAKKYKRCIAIVKSKQSLGI
jgi:hypothetical protein